MHLMLKAMREARHMSQSELAEAIGSTLRKVSSWELQEVRIPLMEAAKIADVFDCSLDELAGRDFQPVAGYADPRQARLNEAYASLSDSGKTHLVRSAEAECALERGAAGGTPMADVTQQVG